MSNNGKITLKVIPTGATGTFLKKPRVKEASLEETWESFLINNLKLRVKLQLRFYMTINYIKTLEF